MRAAELAHEPPEQLWLEAFLAARSVINALTVDRHHPVTRPHAASVCLSFFHNMLHCEAPVCAVQACVYTKAPCCEVHIERLEVIC